LRLWTLCFGDSLTGLRALGATCGIAAIGAGIFAAREVGRTVRLDERSQVAFVSIAAMLLSVSTLPIEMAREVRPYPLMILTYALATGAVFRISRRVADGERLWCGAYVTYLLLLAILLWLHNLGVLYAAALGLAFLILCRWRGWTRADWTALIAGHAIVLVIWLPALAILADQAPTWMNSTWLRFTPSWRLVPSVAKIFFAPEVTSSIAVALLCFMIWLRLPRRGEGLRTVAALSVLFAFPIAASILISATISPIFIVRTMSPVAIPGMLFLALGVASARSVIMWAVGLLALLVILTEMITLDVHQRRMKPQEDWYRALAWLEPRFRPGDMVLAYPNEGALPFRFAVRDKRLTMPTRPIPTDMPTLDGGPGAWNPTGSRGVFSLPKASLETIASAPETQHVPTVWLLRQGPWAYDKGNHFLHALERDRARVGHFFSFPIDIIGLRRKDLPPVSAPQQSKP
jgi:hypothetical protein